MTTLNYLTVQDVIWINTRLTGRENEFESLNLEEGVYYQYVSGSAPGAQTQAARLAAGILKNRPFSQGNEGTAVAAALIFLSINDYVIGDIDIAAVHGGFQRPGEAQPTLDGLKGGDNTHGHISVSEAGEAIFRKYGDELVALSSVPV